MREIVELKRMFLTKVRPGGATYGAASRVTVPALCGLRSSLPIAYSSCCLSLSADTSC